MEKAREFQKNIYFCFIDYAKAFDCVDHNKTGKFLKRWEYQTTLPVSWEICMWVKNQVRNGHGTTDWFKIGKGVLYIVTLLIYLYAEYIRRNARLDEAQTGITIARRNINNLRFTDDNSLMGESEEKLRRFLMKVKEESEKSALELNISAFKKLTSWHPVPPLHGK